MLRSILSFAGQHFIFCWAAFYLLVRTILSFGAHHLLFCCAAKFPALRSTDQRWDILSRHYVAVGTLGRGVGTVLCDIGAFGMVSARYLAQKGSKDYGKSIRN